MPVKSFKEFCDGVLREIPRATGAERNDIRLELTDHLLEHRDILVERGYEPLEAERRAIAAMGDPTEIGKAWNEKLSPFWLWLGRVCIVLVIVLLWNHFPQIGFRMDRMLKANEVRHSEDAGTRIDPMQGCDLLWEEDPGIEKSFGEHIIRVHRVQLWEDSYMEEKYFILKIYVVSYHKDLMGKSLNMNAFHRMEFDGGEDRGGGGGETVYATWLDANVQVKPGQETVRATLDYHGNHFETDIRLDWGELNRGGEAA